MADLAHRGSIRSRFWMPVLLLGCLLAVGCAHSGARPTVVTNLPDRVMRAARASHLEPESVGRWRVEAFTGAPGSSPAVVRELPPGSSSLLPFESSLEIQAFAERNTRGATTSFQKVSALLKGVYAVGNIEEQYEAGRSRTAAETLASRRGNCFSFTNLFVAAARSIGLDAYYMDASRGNSNLRMEGGRLVHSGHIVAGVETNIGHMTIDFYKLARRDQRFWYRRLDDLEVIALFVNNLGYEAMRHQVDAEPYFRTAIALAPELESPWNNLATLLNGQGRQAEAEALLVDATSRQVASFAPYYNLALMYYKEGRYDAAEELFRKAYWRRRDNPYLFYSLGMNYLQQGKTSRARWAFKQAVKLDKTQAGALTKLERLTRK